MLKLRFYQIVPVAVAGLFSVAAQIAMAAPISTSEMVLALREAKVVSPSSNLEVVKGQQEVTITTKKLKMTERDCKIKAVLMAKALMDLQPKQLAAVKVIYTIDGENAINKVVVGAGDVQSFANGTITEDQLLGSLDFSKESGDSSVVAGQLKDLQLRIETLKQGGTGVAPFQKMFNDIADLTKAGKVKEASQLISDLSSKLSSQEGLRDQAKRVGAGGGIKGQQGTAPVVSAQPASKQFNNPNNTSQRKIQEKVSCLRSHLQEVQNAGEFQSRISSAEQQASSSPDAAFAALMRIEADMMKACHAR
jgi:hypothetical protein